MTIGEDRVRIKFNPSGNSDVDDIKRRAAEAIDWCEAHKAAAQSTGGQSEVIRLLALAQTAFEEGAMWAVKAATA